MTSAQRGVQLSIVAAQMAIPGGRYPNEAGRRRMRFSGVRHMYRARAHRRTRRGQNINAGLSPVCLSTAVKQNMLLALTAQAAA